MKRGSKAAIAVGRHGQLTDGRSRICSGHWLGAMFKLPAIFQGVEMNGGCLCGTVRYKSDVAPVYQLYCHCRDCQKVSGSASAPIIFFPSQGLSIEGEVTYYESKGSSGKSIYRGFCSKCGSQLFGRLERLPDLLSIRAGTLDDPAAFQPKVHIHVSQAAPWEHIDPSLRSFPHDVPQR